ncbi:MAG: ATP-binding protein [Planctomycetota bacterium]
MAHRAPSRSPFFVSVTGVWVTALSGVLAVVLGLPRWSFEIVLLVAAALTTAVIARHLGAGSQRGALGTIREELDRAFEQVGAPTARETGPGDESLVSEAARHSARARALARWASAERGRATARAELAETLFASVGEPAIAFDAEGVAVAANKAFDAEYGSPGDTSVGRAIEELFTQRDLLRVHAQALDGESLRERVRATLAGGVRVIDVSAVPVRDGGGVVTLIVMTLRDVTELARAVALKTDFVANASHELRTPLASIAASVETLGDLEESEHALRNKLVRVIGVNAARLREMVEDLLDLSRLESPDALVVRRRFRIETLEDTLGPMYEGLCADRGLGLRFEVDPTLGEMESDRKLVLLVLKNLVDNAAKFAREGTDVTVAMGPTEGPVRAEPSDSVAGLTYGSADLADSPLGPGVWIEVRDRGMGIPMEHQKRIFERFYQVDTARTGGERRGTGLGLAIVKHAVRALGGTIELNSVWQRGTTIRVELPGRVTESDRAQTR